MTRTKVTIAGVVTAALLLGVGAGAHAQNGAQTKERPGAAQRGLGPALKAGLDERRAARSGAVHDLLAITPAQEGAWSAYQAAIRPARLERPDGQRGPGPREEMQGLTAPQRLDRMVEQENTRHAQLLTRANATRQFYGQLSATQKKAFDALPQLGAGRGGRGGPGFGPGGQGGRGMDGRTGPGPRGARGGPGEGPGPRGPRPPVPAA